MVEGAFKKIEVGLKEVLEMTQKAIAESTRAESEAPAMLALLRKLVEPFQDCGDAKLSLTAAQAVFRGANMDHHLLQRAIDARAILARIDAP